MARADAPATASRGETSERALLAIVALGTILAPLNSTMIAVALPSLAADFHIGIAASGWLVIGYLIVMAVVQPIAGSLGDAYGRRSLFLGALVGFLAASLAAAMSPSFPALVTFRMAQAICGALIIPNGAALIREQLPTHRYGSAFGLIGAATGAAAGLGPPLGGALVGLGGWHAIFLANVPVVAVGLLLAWWVLPRGTRAGAGSRFDLAGALLLAGWLGGLALSASSIRAPVVGVPAEVLAVSTAILLGGFVWRELRTPRPVVRLQIFGTRGFSGASAIIALGNLAMYSTLVALPQVITLVLARPAAEAGLILAALSVPLAALAPLSGRWSDRWGRRPVALVGSVLAAAAFAPLLWLGPSWPAWILVFPLAVAGCGLALQTPSIQALAIESAPVELAGMASGAFSTSRYIGSILGTALLAAMLGESAKPSPSAIVEVFVMVEVAALGALICAALLPRPALARGGAREKAV